MKSKEMVNAQILIDSCHSSDNSYIEALRQKSHNGRIGVAYFPQIEISLETLNNLSIGQISKHHDHICRELKDRSGQVTAAKKSSFESPLFSLTPLTNSKSANAFPAGESQTASQLLDSCDVDNWDEEIAELNLNCVTIKNKVNSIARKRVEGVFS